MLKKLFRNYPDFGARGHYVFYDESSSDPNYSDSNGLPPRNDKFRGKDLYTSVKEYDLNQNIVGYQMVPFGDSFIKIKELKIENNGVKHKIVSNRVRAWIFDDSQFKNIGNQSASITGLSSYNDIEKILVSGDTAEEFEVTKFFDSSFPTQDENASLGQVIENSMLVENISKADNDERVYGQFDGNNVNFDINGSLIPPADEDAATLLNNTSFTNLFAFNSTRQRVYIVIQMKGNATAWYDSNDFRKSSFQIFSFDPSILFTQSGGLRENLNFTFGNSKRYEGFGSDREDSPLIESAEKSAWRCTSLKLEISTESEVQQPNVPIGIEPFEDQVRPSVELDMNSFEESFLDQKPNQAIYNLYSDYYEGQSEINVMDNFEPVAITKITSLDDFDLQAYQISDLDRQFCSAPGEISLDFYISDYETIDYILDGAPETVTEGNYQYEELGYKFYVIDWNDEDDDYEDPEDFIEDIPSDIYELYKKTENNLYKFSDIGTPLHHTYSRPGVKTIKAVLFSHTLEGRIQVVRWKFIKTRIFLDIPINQYPEFVEYGGDSFETIPWPITTPIIGGTDLSSDYQVSISETLSGGKIGDTDIIDELFLISAQENNELGKSIEEFDLEQVRYFNTGIYDMNRLLQLNIDTSDDLHSNSDYWDCRDWNNERIHCFPEESSVGQIFISDNLDLTLQQDCKMELNCADMDRNIIHDSNGDGNQGIIIGDYKIKKRQKGKSMKRDSFIKVPKKASSTDGAL